MSEEDWDRWEEEESRGRGLEAVLEEAYAWAVIRGSRLYNVLYSAVRGSSGGAVSAGRGGRDLGFEYELETGDR